MSKNVWFGTDVSPKCSLFDNGVLLRRRRKGWYEVFAQFGEAYVLGEFWLDGTIADMDEEKSWGKIGECVGMSAEEYRKHITEDYTPDGAAAELVSDLLMYYGVDDVLIHPNGCDMPIYTENEVKIRLNKALAA